MKTKLLFFLQKMEKKEQKHFFEYVRSPFFNKNKKLLSLLAFLENYAPEYKSGELTAEKAYQSVYGTEDFNELRLNNLTSDLMQLLYDFFAYREYEKQPAQKIYWTGKALLRRDLPEQMKSVFRRFDNVRKKTVTKDAISIMHEVNYHDLKDEWTISGGKRGYSQSLIRKRELLEEYSFLRQLEIACDTVSRNAAIQANYNTTFIKEVINQYESDTKRWSSQPAILIYYTTLKMLMEPKAADHYQALKKLLQDHPEIFNKDELRTIYNFALNFCVRQINSGFVDYYEEVLTLYKILLDYRIIYKNGYLSQWTFTNICTAGIRLERYDWTTSFIRDYQDDLPPSHRTNVVNYNLAALYYAQKNWDKALQLLQTVIFTDAYYQTAAKTIQLKIYYENKELEAFLSLIDSFDKFIQRNRQLSAYQKKSNRNFISFAAKLSKIRESQYTRSKKICFENLDKLLEKIKETHPIANKNWLLTQAEKMKRC